MVNILIAVDIDVLVVAVSLLIFVFNIEFNDIVFVYEPNAFIVNEFADSNAVDIAAFLSVPNIQYHQ